MNRPGFRGGGECTEDSLSGVRRGKYPEELRGWAARRAEGVVPAPGRESQTSSKDPRLLSFFDAFAYALAYLLVISALVCIDNPLPMPATVHGLRGQFSARH